MICKVKKEIYKATLWILLLITFGAVLRAEEISFGWHSPRVYAVGRDSLCVAMSLDLSRVKAGKAEAYRFTPVLRGGGKLLELPAVVVSGVRRTRADRRKQMLEPEEGYISPYRVLHKADRRDRVDYRITLAYNSWMQHASLVLMREERDCCRMKILGIETLLADLNLKVSSGIIQEEVVISQQVAEKQVSGIDRSSTQNRPSCLPCAECTAMVTYLTPDMEVEKHRSESTTLYIDYPTGGYDVRREFLNNQAELYKLDSLLHPLTEGNLTRISGISICGYASPDGKYEDNEKLASSRARCFKEYMCSRYGLEQSLFQVTSVPEDWDELIKLLNRYPMAHSDELLSLIARVGIFEGREKQLMEMRGGSVYRKLLKDYFPRLRRIRVTVDYEVRAFNIEEAVGLIYTHPRLLSLQEMYRIATFYRPGTEQYREVYEIAAYHFPDDVIANINAASAVIMAGDTVSARQYLNKVYGDPRAWNDFGVLAYLEGDLQKAEEWFRKALGVEPEKARKNLRQLNNHPIKSN